MALQMAMTPIPQQAMMGAGPYQAADYAAQGSRYAGVVSREGQQLGAGQYHMDQLAANTGISCTAVNSLAARPNLGDAVPGWSGCPSAQPAMPSLNQGWTTPVPASHVVAGDWFATRAPHACV